ncbi:MAG: YkgJ family cysteine cluster protein [Candidatus Helarchaeota archaeon]
MIQNFSRFISNRVKESTFSCIRCGNCCKFSEIILSNREIQAISTHLNLKIQDFINQFLVKKKIHKIRNIFADKFEIKGEVYVLKKDETKNCPFFEEIAHSASCKIYPFRPIVCRLFPFSWKTFKDEYSHISVAIDFSQNGWDECQGINHEQGSSWDTLREEVTGAVLLSIIQSNELIDDGFIIQTHTNSSNCH